MSAGLDRSAPCGVSRFVVASLLAASLLPACGSSSMMPPPDPWPVGNIVLHDANNYSSLTTLTVPTIQTTPAADLEVCWDGVMKDLLCHALVPDTGDIDNVSFLQIPNMTHAQVADKLAIGQLDENLVRI